MYERALAYERKRKEAMEWVGTYIRTVWEEQRKLWSHLERERKWKRLTASMWCPVVLALAAALFGVSAITSWGGPNPTETAMSGLMTLVSAVLLIGWFAAGWGQQDLTWVDEVHRAQETLVQGMLRIANRLGDGAEEEFERQVVLGFLDTQTGFEFTRSAHPWKVMRNDERVERWFRQTVYALQCIDRRTGVMEDMREDFDWLVQSGAAANGYNFDEIIQRLNQVLRG